MICTRCSGTGFLNTHQLDFDVFDLDDPQGTVLEWIDKQTEPHDVQVCDCCGDGEGWHGTPGEHYGSDDPQGDRGPYGNNGGLCQCH
jgi:hypothetical protein